MSGARPVVFRAGDYGAVELGPDDAPRLQAFFDANPEYNLRVEGRPPPPDTAQTELAAHPPDGWPYSKRWLLGLDDAQGSMIGVADVTADLLAAHVWHVGLFIVATALHGTGAAQVLYGALEAWMRDAGAQWLRLGVVDGNVRAERFWRRAAYIEARMRTGVEMGERVNDVRVMVKPLDGGALAAYLALVPRDRADSP